MKCNKPYSVTSDNPKMSGSEKPMSYMGGGMVKSYQKGGMVTKSKPMSKGPQGPRSYPGQNLARKERREKEQMLVEQAKGEEMTERMQEARRRFYNQ